MRFDVHSKLAGDEKHLRFATMAKPNQVLSRYIFPKEKGLQRSPFSFGAGDENRTHNHSLGSCCFATKLHLRLGFYYNKSLIFCKVIYNSPYKIKPNIADIIMRKIGETAFFVFFFVIMLIRKTVKNIISAL